MNGYKRILMVAERELERCNHLMAAARRDEDATAFLRWVKHSMHVEDVIGYIQIKIEVNK